MSRESFLSVIRSESEDPSALYLFDVTLGMELAGYDTDEIFRNGIDGEKSAKSLIATARRFGTDACNGSVMWFDSRFFGNDVVFPKKGIPYVSRFTLSEPDRLHSLDNSAIPKEMLDQIALSHRIVSETLDAALVYHTPSPFGAASSLRGLQNVLMDMLLEPGYVDELIAFTSETVRIVHERVAQEVAPDMCLISGAYDDIDIIGTELMERFSVGPLKNALGFLSSSGEALCFHPHGTLSAEWARPLVRDYQDMGIDCLYYGEYNEPRRIHEYGPKMSLMGGIDTFTTITLGDNGRVVHDTEKCIADMRGCSYVFSCSCSVDRGLSVERMDTMCSTVKGLRQN